MFLQDVASANGSNLKLRLGALGFILLDIIPARIKNIKTQLNITLTASFVVPDTQTGAAALGAMNWML